MALIEGMVLSGIPGGKLMAINALTGDVQWEGVVAVPKGSTDLERVNDVVGSPAVVGPLLCAVAHQDVSSALILLREVGLSGINLSPAMSG